MDGRGGALKDRRRLNRVRGGQRKETKRKNNREARDYTKTSAERKETLSKVTGKTGNKELRKILRGTKRHWTALPPSK